ncbi:MAG: hypothetical protein AB7P49_20410 [Bdellovibrionales bacterium]
MSDSSVDPVPIDPAFRFEAVPYRAEGGHNLPGLILVLAFCLGGGVPAGLLGGWIGQWFYLIVVFPIAIGAVVGFFGALAADWGKLRNPSLGMLAGILGGCLAMAAMHYFEFRAFLHEVEKTNPAALQLQFSPSEFAQFIDQSAVAGVQIVGRPGQNAMNLGYYGSYIYWILEVVIVAFIAGAIVASVASSPFCSECETWKVVRQLGKVNVPRAVALEAITSGEIIRLAGQDLAPGPGRLNLAAAVCPNCASAVPVDITFTEVTVNSKGGEQSAQIAHVTYPGQALHVFEALFEEDSQGTSSKKEAGSTASPRPQRNRRRGKRIVLTPAKRAYVGETWDLELDEDMAVLVNDDDEVLATIPFDETTGRIVFPSFWESVRNLGILADDGKVIWFKPEKSAIKEIKYHLNP